jgi:hypothetical protein
LAPLLGGLLLLLTAIVRFGHWGYQLMGPLMTADLAFAMGANDHLAIFVRGKALAAGVCGALFHGRAQSNTFNRADFRKAGLAQDEARFAASSGRALLLWHARNLSHIFLFATPSG